MKNASEVIDIRTNLPVAIKGGTSSKPIWENNKNRFRFVKPLNKQGKNPQQRKTRLGRTALLAKYRAGTTKSGKDLMFVGVFQPVS